MHNFGVYPFHLAAVGRNLPFRANLSRPDHLLKRSTNSHAFVRNCRGSPNFVDCGGADGRYRVSRPTNTACSAENPICEISDPAGSRSHDASVAADGSYVRNVRIRNGWILSRSPTKHEYIRIRQVASGCHPYGRGLDPDRRDWIVVGRRRSLVGPWEAAARRNTTFIDLAADNYHFRSRLNPGSLRPVVRPPRVSRRNKASELTEVLTTLNWWNRQRLSCR